MKKIQLPCKEVNNGIEKLIVHECALLGTTTGIVKDENEDVIGALVGSKMLRVCIADGHWGKTASQRICDACLNPDVLIPSSEAEASKFVSSLENELFEAFGSANMDETKDFTPEASFIVLEVDKDSLHITAYGDCRMLVIRNKRIVFQLETKETWLGAFSRLGLRKRQPANEATIFKNIHVIRGDTVLLFTDGVDQCVYEKPTISFKHIATMVDPPLNTICDRLFREVFKHGAEDNASLGIIRIQ